MKRELKFRAWDGVMMFDPLNDRTPFKLICERDIVMQYTGLKDKNGVEVYEGSLLQIPYNDFIQEGLHEVYFHEDGYVTSSVLFKDKEKATKNCLGWILKKGAYVVGNIYQNPELI